MEKIVTYQDEDKIIKITKYQNGSFEKEHTLCNMEINYLVLDIKKVYINEANFLD